jgi:general secretion pathway protein H
MGDKSACGACRGHHCAGRRQKTWFLPAGSPRRGFCRLRGSGRGFRRVHIHGFTLVEILVVVVIIAIVSAGVILSVNLTGRDSDLEKESNRLLALVNYAREQAELQTREYGLLFRDDGYEFLTFDVRRGWRDVYEDDALRDRNLPAGLDVRLSVEGRPVVLTKPKDAKDKTPQVMIYSNGDLTSFEITVERENGVRSVTLKQDEKGQVVEGELVENKT